MGTAIGIKGGKIYIVGGKIMMGCCCGESYNCCTCGICCFADNSTATIILDLDTTGLTARYKAVIDAWITAHGSEHELAFVAEECGVWATSFATETLADFNITNFTITLTRDCSNDEWHFNVNILMYSGSGESIDEINIEFSDVEPIQGDCCGPDTQEIEYQYQQIAQSPAAVDLYGTFFNDFSAEIANNLCCNNGEGCTKLEGHCDGSCCTVCPTEAQIADCKNPYTITIAGSDREDLPDGDYYVYRATGFPPGPIYIGDEFLLMCAEVEGNLVWHIQTVSDIPFDIDAYKTSNTCCPPTGVYPDGLYGADSVTVS